MTAYPCITDSADTADTWMKAYPCITDSTDARMKEYLSIRVSAFKSVLC